MAGEIPPEVASILQGMGLGALIQFILAFILLFVIILIAFYIYTSLAYMTIGKKLKYAYPWLAWIPVANIAMMLSMGGFHWAWVFLILIPFLGWAALFVLIIIATWRIYEKRNYPGALALVGLAGFIPFLGWFAGIANLVIIGMVAWADRKK